MNFSQVFNNLSRSAPVKGSELSTSVLVTASSSSHSAQTPRGVGFVTRHAWSVESLMTPSRDGGNGRAMGDGLREADAGDGDDGLRAVVEAVGSGTATVAKAATGV
eukprot:11816300-Alexandrium_andersonii.AAC.1